MNVFVTCILLLSYVRRGLFFFLFGVRCTAYTQYKVHAYSMLKWIPLTRERSVYSAGENVKDLAALLKQLKNGMKGLENEVLETGPGVSDK